MLGANWQHDPTGPTSTTERAVFIQGGFRCRWCGSGEDLVVSPIVPESYGGDPTSTTNLRTVCRPCADARFLAEGVSEQPRHAEALRRVLSIPSRRNEVVATFKAAALAKERDGGSYHSVRVFQALDELVKREVGWRLQGWERPHDISPADWEFLCSSQAYDAVVQNILN